MIKYYNCLLQHNQEGLQIKMMNKEMGQLGETKIMVSLTGKVADPYPSH